MRPYKHSSDIWHHYKKSCCFSDSLHISLFKPYFPKIANVHLNTTNFSVIFTNIVSNCCVWHENIRTTFKAY